MVLSDYILERAKGIQLCKPVFAKIALGANAHELLQLFIDNIDFCLEHSFPSNNDLKEHGGSVLKEFGIYVDSSVAVNNPDNLVMLGSSSGEVKVNNANVSKIYMKDTSVLRVTCTGRSLVLVDVFDASALEIRASGHSNVLVNVYGNATVTPSQDASSRITIVHKNQSTY